MIAKQRNRAFGIIKTMETEILQSLQDVGYSGTLLDTTKLNQALQEGAKSPEFTKLISWLTDQISAFAKIDDTVHPISSADDSNSFLLELSTYLKELGCVNSKLTTGNVNQRLTSLDEKIILIEYLVSELMSCKILEAKRPKDTKAVQITISESITAKSLREMLTTLKFQKPPDNISTEVIFKKLQTKLTELLGQVPKELIGKPLFFGELSPKQWQKLDEVQGDLNDEYTIRREMLLQRLDVTVNSFLWSERTRPKENELNKCYHTKRDAMKREPDVTLANLLSARDDLAIIEKTSNASVRKNTRSAVNTVIIGAVPDRGGRPYEQEPPPPEMPPWQKDKVQGPQRGGFGGGGGGRGGGRGGGGRGGGGGSRGGGQGSAGGFRDNKSVSSNFGQNFDNSQKQFSSFGNSNSFSSYEGNRNSSGYSSQNSNYRSQTSGYGNQSSTGYKNQNSGYGNQSSNYMSQGSSYNQGSSYSNQGSGYTNQSSGYGNQGSGYNNQGYDKKSGSGDYNRDQSQRGGRVQGGWNQVGDSSNSSNYNKGGYNNSNQGYGSGRRYKYS